MHVISTNQSEIRAVIDTVIELTNLDEASDDDAVRSILQQNGFSRSKNASEASYRRLRTRLKELEPLVRDLPLLSVAEASHQINEQLVEFPISPVIADHHDFGPHMHWTSNTATFDDQIIADFLMGLALEVCDNGTIRFGTCGASNCDDMFYDNTRNRSRRFCADPKCASRTHTADHRARQGT